MQTTSKTLKALANLDKGLLEPLRIVGSVYPIEAVDQAISEFRNQGLKFAASDGDRLVVTCGTPSDSTRELVGRFLTRLLELSANRGAR
jgi:hypothetical protein